MGKLFLGIILFGAILFGGEKNLTQWVEQLGSPAYKEREAASHHLAELLKTELKKALNGKFKKEVNFYETDLYKNEVSKLGEALRTTPCPETAARLRRILVPYSPFVIDWKDIIEGFFALIAKEAHLQEVAKGADLVVDAIPALEMDTYVDAANQNLNGLWEKEKKEENEKRRLLMYQIVSRNIRLKIDEKAKKEDKKMIYFSVNKVPYAAKVETNGDVWVEKRMPQEYTYTPPSLIESAALKLDHFRELFRAPGGLPFPEKLQTRYSFFVSITPGRSSLTYVMIPKPKDGEGGSGGEGPASVIQDVLAKEFPKENYKNYIDAIEKAPFPAPLSQSRYVGKVFITEED